MTYIVGISGGSGSGKTTFANKLLDKLGPDAVLISHDSYYKHTPGMTQQERAAYNFDIPQALDTWLLVQHLHQLKAGEAAEIPIYDFETQERKAQTTHVDPVSVVIVEGILALADEKLRQLYDLSVYVDVDADVRVLRRIKRDIEERGHYLDGAIQMYLNAAKPAHERYVEPSKAFANVVIQDATNEKVVATIAAGIRANAGVKQ